MVDEATSKTDFEVIRYNTLAAGTFLFYDMLLVLPLEVELIWKQRWSSGKLLYIWNRLLGLCALVLDTTAYFDASLPKEVNVSIAAIILFLNNMSSAYFRGLFIYWWEGISALVAVLTIEVILQERIYAVYEGNKKLLFVMVGCFLVNVGVASFLFIKYMRKWEDLESRKWYSYFWVPSIVFETFLCLLMIFRIITLYRREVRNPLLIVLIRDSIMYFVIVLLLFLTNCIGNTLRPDASPFGLGWVLAVSCALGSRLLLNIRREYFADKEPFTESSADIALGDWPAPWSGVLSSVVLDTSGETGDTV